MLRSRCNQSYQFRKYNTRQYWEMIDWKSLEFSFNTGQTYFFICLSTFMKPTERVRN